MNLFDDLFNEHIPDITDQFDSVESNISRVTVEQTVELALTSEEKFSIMMALNFKDQKKFENFLSLFRMIGDERLISNVNNSINNPHVAWSNISGYTAMEDSLLRNMLEGNRGISPLIHVRAAQRSLWSAGHPALCIGLDAYDSSSFSHLSEVKESMLETVNIIKGFEHEKLDAMKNVLKSIIACAPSDIRDKFKTRQGMISEVKTIIQKFVGGKLPYRLSPKLFKASKEPGVTLPHTLSPKDWLGTMTTALIEKEFGKDVLVTFREGDVNQIRQYDGAMFDYLLISSEEDSAYSIDYTPAIYAHNLYDDDGVWQWRVIEDVIKKKVSYQITELGLEGQQQSERDAMRKEFELSAAKKLKGRSDTIHFHPGRYLARIPDGISSLLGKTSCVRFYKRGFSKKTEIIANPDFLHVCKNSIVDSLPSGAFYPVMLADFNTIVLLPMDLWSRSAHVRTAGSLAEAAPYRSSVGIKKINRGMDYIQLFYTLLQLSHVFYMYECWKSKTTYDPVEYNNKIIPLLRSSRDSSFESLFPGTMSKPERRSIMISSFTPVALGPIRGMWLAPATSSLGKAGLSEIKSDQAFIREMSQYEDAIPNEYGNLDELNFSDLYGEESSTDESDFDFFESSDERSVYPEVGDQVDDSLL